MTNPTKKAESSNYYRILGTNSNASDELIKERYLEKVRAFPPEKDPEEFINLGWYWDQQLLFSRREEIIQLNKIIKENFHSVYRYLKIAHLLEEQLKSFYSNSLHKKQNEKQRKNIISEYISIVPNKKETGYGKERHLFASALTPEGPINYLNNITDQINNKIIIKGEPGTNRHLLTREIAEITLRAGYDLLLLHHPLNPTDIQTIINKELDMVITTDMEITNNSNSSCYDLSDGLNSKQVKSLSSEIKNCREQQTLALDRVLKYLQQAKKVHDQMEEYYIKAMNFKEIDRRREELLTKYLSSIGN